MQVKEWFDPNSNTEPSTMDDVALLQKFNSAFDQNASINSSNGYIGDGRYGKATRAASLNNPLTITKTEYTTTFRKIPEKILTRITAEATKYPSVTIFRQQGDLSSVSSAYLEEYFSSFGNNQKDVTLGIYGAETAKILNTSKIDVNDGKERIYEVRAAKVTQQLKGSHEKVDNGGTENIMTILGAGVKNFEGGKIILSSDTDALPDGMKEQIKESSAGKYYKSFIDYMITSKNAGSITIVVPSKSTKENFAEIDMQKATADDINEGFDGNKIDWGTVYDAYQKRLSDKE
jgi:hypothetical protein